MKITHLLLGAAVCVSGLALTACGGDNDDNGARLNEYINFVTLKESTASGAVMTFQKENDSPLITLTTTQPFDSRIFKPGTRIVVDYLTTSDGYTSGPVTVARAVNTEGLGAAPAEKTAEETKNWASDNITMVEAQRSGEYINLVFTASTYGDPKECAVYVDKNTIGTENPCLYLVFEAANATAAPSYYFYASYSIADLWEDTTTKSVTLYYPDLNTGNSHLVFVKSASTLTPAN